MQQTPSTRSILTNLEVRAAALGLNFTVLCREAGIAYSTYARWRNGDTDPLMKVGKIDAAIRKHEEAVNQ